jgi:hypothetical protein
MSLRGLSSITWILIAAFVYLIVHGFGTVAPTDSLSVTLPATPATLPGSNQAAPYPWQSIRGSAQVGPVRVTIQ